MCVCVCASIHFSIPNNLDWVQNNKHSLTNLFTFILPAAIACALRPASPSINSSAHSGKRHVICCEKFRFFKFIYYAKYNGKLQYVFIYLFELKRHFQKNCTLLHNWNIILFAWSEIIFRIWMKSFDNLLALIFISVHKFILSLKIVLSWLCALNAPNTKPVQGETLYVDRRRCRIAKKQNRGSQLGAGPRVVYAICAYLLVCAYKYIYIYTHIIIVLEVCATQIQKQIHARINQPVIGFGDNLLLLLIRHCSKLYQ